MKLTASMMLSVDGVYQGPGPNLKLEELRAIGAPGVAHLKYRVVK